MNFLESLENTNKNQRILREIEIFENTYNQVIAN